MKSITKAHSVASLALDSTQNATAGTSSRPARETPRTSQSLHPVLSTLPHMESDTPGTVPLQARVASTPATPLERKPKSALNKLRGAIKKQGERRFVSGQISLAGLHTITTTGMPVKLPTQHGEKISMPSAPDAVPPDQLPIPPVMPPLLPAHHTKVAGAIQASFAAPTSR